MKSAENLIKNLINIIHVIMWHDKFRIDSGESWALADLRIYIRMK